MSKTVTYNDVKFTLEREGGWIEFRCHVCSTRHMKHTNNVYEIAELAMRHAIHHNEG